MTKSSSSERVKEPADARRRRHLNEASRLLAAAEKQARKAGEDAKSQAFADEIGKLVRA